MLEFISRYSLALAVGGIGMVNYVITKFIYPKLVEKNYDVVLKDYARGAGVLLDRFVIKYLAMAWSFVRDNFMQFVRLFNRER